MNTTEKKELSTVYSAIEVSLSVVGILVCVANVMVLAVIARLLSSKTFRDRNGMILHTLFVSVNDTLCGVVVFIIGLIRVNGIISAFMCVYLSFLSLALQVVSQANITCVCAIRFVVSRNMNKMYETSMYHTRILLLVNVLIGTITMVSFVLATSVRYSPSESGSFCSLAKLVRGNLAVNYIAYFAFGILFTLTTDILCLMTIVKLRNKMNTITAFSKSDSANDGATNVSNASESVRITSKLRQQRAMLTILLIVVLFNISFIPAFSGYTYALAGGYIPPWVQRANYAAFFLNSLGNPVIIITRVEDVRTTLQTAVFAFGNKVFRLFIQ